mmetsp:Transcript_25484/g.51816  ORF Transcript_25484/g.51816 Transcript_25484/m.51816 type:complete len:153 (+) Transcript_25484:859-1317(+)
MRKSVSEASECTARVKLGRGTEEESRGEPTRGEGDSKGMGDDPAPVGVMGRRERGVWRPEHVPETFSDSPDLGPKLHNDSNLSTVPWYRLSLTVWVASFHGVRRAPSVGERGGSSVSRMLRRTTALNPDSSLPLRSDHGESGREFEAESSDL